MDGYFNIFHIIVIFAISVISLLLLYVCIRNENGKNLIALIGINIVVTSVIGFIAMVVIDKYTKEVVLENVTNQRVLRNETIVFRGAARNTGDFSVSKCNITIKMINNPLSKDMLKGEVIFKPSGLAWFSWLSKEDKDNRPNTMEFKVGISSKLKPREAKNFTVAVPYPPYFTNTTFITKIKCY